MSADGGGSRVEGVEKPGGVGLVHTLSYLVGCEPGHLNDLVSGTRLAGNDAGSEDQRDDPAAHVLVDARQGFGLDLQAGLLADFSHQAGGDGLVQLKDATGWLPMAVVAPGPCTWCS